MPVRDRDDTGGSLIVLAGIRLFRGRGDLDAALREIAEITDDDRYAVALDAVRKFNERAPLLPMDLPADVPGPLDEQLAFVIEPLARAVETLTGRVSSNHWIRLDAVAPGGAVRA